MSTPNDGVAGRTPHTPTPWLLGHERVAGRAISWSICPTIDDSGNAGDICTVRSATDTLRSCATHRANAALIVHAVNSHAALVAALTEALYHDAVECNRDSPWHPTARAILASSAAFANRKEGV
jgi:hypothetical protein